MSIPSNGEDKLPNYNYSYNVISNFTSGNDNDYYYLR